MNIFSIKQLVVIAKYTSPIYSNLYRDICEHTNFEDLPILTNEKLMEIVHDQKPDFVFAEGNTHGLIFESSASTGKPKVTIWGKDEWDSSTTILANTHWKNETLQEGDRVANLCASAYLSYRIVHSVIEKFPGRCSEVPIGCERPVDELISLIEKYQCNVLAGVNSVFLGIAWEYHKKGIVNESVVRILGGGELLYGFQSALIKKAFPNAIFISFMFGTTESGMVGYSQLDDDLDTFRVFNGTSIVEVIDENSGTPIKIIGKKGKCVVTSLLRTAAPAIRVDTGDYAIWLDEPSSKNARFRILGRKFPFYQSFFSVQFNETDVWNIIKKIEIQFNLLKLQLKLSQEKMVILYSSYKSDTVSSEQEVSFIKIALFEVLPHLKKYESCISMIKADFDIFLESTKRKGRLIELE